MKHFLIICCCIYYTNVTAQYAAHTPADNIYSFEENVNISEEKVNYTKLTTENCSKEIGFGLSDCGFDELNKFMSKIPYPSKAIELDIRDKCRVTFTGTKEGKTENVTVSECMLSVFQNPIQQHLSNMTWQPVYKNGEAIDFEVTFNMEFNND